jgi:hypothetical protein
MPRSAAAAIVALGLLIACLGSSPAHAQVQSTLDTMWIIAPPAVVRGQEVDIDIRLHIVDTLGAFAYRLLYDTLVFEPVQDTFELSGDTVVGIIATDLHPGHFEQFAGSVRAPGVITFLAADLDLEPATLCFPGTFPAVRMRWRVLPNAPVASTNIYFENDSLLPATWNAMTDHWGEDFWRPVFVNATTSIACACFCLAEPGECNGALNIVDVLATVNIAFRGTTPVGDPDPSCPVTRSDVNCDGQTTIVDVIKIIEVAFRAADPTATFCNPCE